MHFKIMNHGALSRYQQALENAQTTSQPIQCLFPLPTSDNQTLQSISESSTLYSDTVIKAYFLDLIDLSKLPSYH